MATPQQWRHAGLLLGATLVVLFIGSAEAWKSCPEGYKNCDAYKHDCGTCIKTDVNHCGDCHKKCKELPNTIVKCYKGHCEYKCKHGWGDCDRKLYYTGCEKDVSNDKDNCGYCGHKCPCTLKGGEAICRHGKCDQQCKKDFKYDHASKCCVRKY